MYSLRSIRTAAGNTIHAIAWSDELECPARERGRAQPRSSSRQRAGTEVHAARAGLPLAFVRVESSTLATLPYGDARYWFFGNEFTVHMYFISEGFLV